MVDDGPSRWDTALDGLSVLIGVGYIVSGEPIFGVDAWLLGGVLVVYGVVSFLVKRVARRNGLFDRN